MGGVLVNGAARLFFFMLNEALSRVDATLRSNTNAFESQFKFYLRTEA
jgi:hypothetical protein